MTAIRIITIPVDELEARIEAAVDRAVERVLAAQRPVEWLDAVAVAKMLGLCEQQVRNLARRGDLPSTKVGSLLRFSRTAIEERMRRAG